MHRDETLLADLNPAQRDAVETLGGPLLILAGPGSGKTRVITTRIAYLVRVCGVQPRHIVAVTFTNKAAKEMRARLERMIGNRASELAMGTFHSLCVRILRLEAQHIGLDNRFVIYDDADQIGLIKEALADLRLDERQYNPRALQSGISKAKSELMDPVEFGRAGRSHWEEVVQRVYTRYQELLRQNNALDFDDLLMVTVDLFRRHPDVLRRYQQRWVHVLVDEFQDTNIAQYVLVKLLAAAHQNICVVGDPDQSIYSWRSADIRNILNFERDYPAAKTVLLEENYRSTKTILEAAERVIELNLQRKPKRLFTQNDDGLPIAVRELYDEREEAEFIAREVERLTDPRRHQPPLAPRDIAVMYRMNAQSRAIEDVFVRSGLPYRLVGGTRFYERKEVKDVLAYLRLVYNPDDSVSLLRVINMPARGIGERTVGELQSVARSGDLSIFKVMESLQTEDPLLKLAPRAEQAVLGFYRLLDGLIDESQRLPVVELLQDVLERSGYREYLLDGTPEGEERWENVRELATVAQQYDELEPREALGRFLEEIALVADVDMVDDQQDAVTLITLHQAKGLEFPVVFIAGLEEGIFPHSRSLDDPNQLEEERRLCYVGITRAKSRLYLLRAFRRTIYGRAEPSQPSRYFKDIPERLIQAPAESRSAVGSRSSGTGRIVIGAEASPALDLTAPDIKAGDAVRHIKFGEGIVMSCEPSKGDYEVTVLFKGQTGQKRLLYSYAGLEKLP